jgi:hypothetical protein
MNITRLYTGSDGQSHLEALDPATHPELATLHATKGEVEIGLGDGTTHRFGPGHVTLAEDLTGRGHTTRVVGSQTRMTATIHLEDSGRS